MGSIGTNELLIIAAVVLLLFGTAWLPRLARLVGRTTSRSAETREQLQQAHRSWKVFDRKVSKASRLMR